MPNPLILNPTAFEAGVASAFNARSTASEWQVAAFERFARLRLPNRRVEGWKWSDFNAVLRSLEPANDARPDMTIAPSAFAALDPFEFQIVDGRIRVPQGETLDGFEFGVVDPAAADPEFDNHALAALNVAMTPKALGFKAKKGAAVARPILIRHINSGGPRIFSQILGRAEDGARLTVIETFEGGAAYHSSLFHMGVRDGATFDHYVLQDGDAESVTHAFFGVMVGKEARFRQTSLSTGGRLARHETHLLHPSPRGTSEIASAGLLSGDRHADFTSIARYRAEECTTRQIHKGVVKDRGRAVFQGKFHVFRGAQKTDADMQANALLLSEGAEANHKPELEIYADDVECAHGSTCGALDDDALFYMRQRGLSDDEARALLINAFVGEVLDGVDHDGVREILAARVEDWLEAR